MKLIVKSVHQHPNRPTHVTAVLDGTPEGPDQVHYGIPLEEGTEVAPGDTIDVTVEVAKPADDTKSTAKKGK